MKKNKKFHCSWRILSLLLALCMTVSLVPITVFAEYGNNLSITTDGNPEDKNTDTSLSAYSTDNYELPVNSNENIITTVDIGNVWKNLSSKQPIAFTTEVNPNSECVNQMEIVEEQWEQSRGSQIIKSTDSESLRYPQAGEEYWYSIVLKAKDGYVFSDEFNNNIKNNVKFICDGTTYNHQIAVRDNGKEFVAWEFLNGVIATDGSDDTVINDIMINGSILSYNIGESPKATATSGNLDGLYTFYEKWEELEVAPDGTSNSVAFWYSDPDEMNRVPDNKKITVFEEGKKYLYSVILHANDGYTFASQENLSVWLKNEDLPSPSDRVSVYDGGKSVEILGNGTMTPTKPIQPKIIELIEINGATINFKSGDKPVFTGKTPDGAPYVYQCERWETDGAGITSADFWNTTEAWGNLIDTFEEGKIYTYGLYLKAINNEYYFNRDTKVRINGQYVNYTVNYYPIDDPDLMPTLWLTTDLTMTPTPSEYKVIEGANSSWIQNSNDTLTFRINGDFSKFTGIKVDGNIVDKSNYTATSGSTIITLNADYLKTLSPGTHKLTVLYIDGECNTDFEIKESPILVGENTTTNNNTSLPQTGDSSSVSILIALLCLSGLGVVGTKVYNKGKHTL